MGKGMDKSKEERSTRVLSQVKNVLLKDSPKPIQVYERIQL